MSLGYKASARVNNNFPSIGKSIVVNVLAYFSLGTESKAFISN
jgi:hypothetical protein